MLRGKWHGMRERNNRKIESSFGKISKEFTNESEFSLWETQIFEMIRISGISIKKKFRNFVLFSGDKKEQYIPDSLVEGFEYKGKEIILEAHEKISEEDVKKYRRFRGLFGSSYYLIMIVTDSEEAIWKEKQKGKEGGIFNEIYTKANMEQLINNLKKWKDGYDEMISQYAQNALCPPPPKGHGCGIAAKGFEEITEIFGYRGKRVQSLCRACRKEHASKQKNKLKN